MIDAGLIDFRRISSPNENRFKNGGSIHVRVVRSQTVKFGCDVPSNTPRLESGRSPSMASLRKYAAATGSRVEIKLSPAPRKRRATS